MNYDLTKTKVITEETDYEGAYAGAIVYNLSLKLFQFYNGAIWLNLGGQP
jgi:hypothetical protein